MTGEITLRGNVLPVGGIKEKCWPPSARGTKMIVPAANKKDLYKIPKKVLREIKFIFVKDVKDVFQEAMVWASARGAAGGKNRTKKKARAGRRRRPRRDRCG